MLRVLVATLALLCLAGCPEPSPAQAAPPLRAQSPQPLGAVGTRRLPIADPEEAAEVNLTLDLIARAGPFPHRQDGGVFGNREGRLPAQTYGYYREYTVRTAGVPTRGARRVVQGAAGDTYYSGDHYRSFVVIDPRRY